MDDVNFADVAHVEFIAHANMLNPFELTWTETTVPYLKFEMNEEFNSAAFTNVTAGTCRVAGTAEHAAGLLMPCPSLLELGRGSFRL